MLELALSVLRITVAVYLGITLFVLLRQSKYVYYPGHTITETPKDVNLPYEEVSLRTPDNETISAWFIPAATNADTAPTILKCHGNAGDLGDRIMAIQTFHRMGFNTFVFDYRGFGRSTGTPSEKGTYTDALAAWNHLTATRGIPASHIVIFGRSLGGAIATWLATQVQPAGLVTESTFTSAPDMARRMFPYLPVSLLCRFKYDSLSRMKDIHCPVLVAHSPEDDMIPFQHAKRLFDAANEPRQFVKTIGDHNGGGLDVDSAFQRDFILFVVKYAGSAGS